MLAVTWVLVSPAHAAIAFVQTASNATGSGTSFNITLSSLTTDNKIICQVKTSNEFATLTPSATNVTFQTAVGPVDDPGGSSNIRTYQFYGRITTGGATAVTITASTTVTMGGWCAEISGLAVTFSLDQTGQGVNGGVGGGGTTHDISGTVVTTQADELLIGGCGPSTTSGTWTVGSGYTAIFTSTHSSIPGGQYRIVSSTGTYSTPMTSASSIASVCLMGTYKMAAPGGGGSRPPCVGCGVFAKSFIPNLGSDADPRFLLQGIVCASRERLCAAMLDPRRRPPFIPYGRVSLCCSPTV